MRTSYLALMTLAVVSTTLSVHATSIAVSNSSFEFVPPTNGSCCNWGDFPDPSLYPSNSTWTDLNGYASGGYATNPVGDHFSYSPDGSSRYLYLRNVGGISQNLNTTVSPGQLVTLNFYDGGDTAHDTGGGGIMSATITVGAQTFSQNFDSTNPMNLGTWNFRTLTGSPTASGNLSISFALVSGIPWLDAVSVSVTPEPASLSIFGLGGMGLLARRRRA